jgi:hypothetical protein
MAEEQTARGARCAVHVAFSVGARSLTPLAFAKVVVLGSLALQDDCAANEVEPRELAQ